MELLLQWESNKCYKSLVCIVLVMQHHCVMLSSVASPAVPYFSMFSHKWHDFLKRLLSVKCVLIFSTLLSETFLILRRIQQAVINVRRSSREVPIFLVRF